MSQTGSYVTALVWETSDGEGPTRAEYQVNWNAMDGHSHDNRGAGRGIRGIQTTSTPTQTGDIQINGDALQWWGASSAAIVTAVNPNVAVPSLLFSGPAGVANSRFVGIVSASGAPTTGTWLRWDYGYDEAGNIWLCTVAGSPGTWIKAGGPALPLSVANGGTGNTTLNSRGVLTGNGTGAIQSSTPGATNTVLHGNSSDFPSFSAITGADIVAGTITADLLCSSATASNPSTASGSMVDIPGLSVTRTTGTKAIVAFTGVLTSTSGSTAASLQVVVDGGFAAGFSFAIPTSGNAINCSFTVPLTVTAASHVIKMQWETNLGTISPYNGGTLYLTVV